MKPENRILFVRPDKAGDAIKSLPALRAFRTRFPEWESHCLASEHNRSLLEAEPGLKVWVLPKNWEILTTAALRDWARASSLPNFARITSLLPDRHESCERLMQALGAELEVVARPERRDECTNIADLVGRAVGADLTSALSQYSRAPLLTAQDAAESLEALGQKHHPWIAVCPLAGDQVRTPNIKRWRRLVRFISGVEKNSRLFLFGAPGDAPALTTIRGQSDPEQVKIIHPSSFRALGAYLQRVDLVLAVDSGPLHFAVSLGCPTIGFMSGGDKARWCANLNARQRVLRRGLFDRFPSSPEMVGYYWWARARAHG